jgi:hypothetical protein
MKMFTQNSPEPLNPTRIRCFVQHPVITRPYTHEASKYRIVVRAERKEAQAGSQSFRSEAAVFAIKDDEEN